MDLKEIAFEGEVMLLQWAESSTRGRTVTFLLNEDDESHPFREFSIKSGKRAGQRFMAVLVEIDDQEQPVRQEQRPSQLAYLLCNDPQFWYWANERSFDKIDSEPAAKNWMLELLGISSRSEIDSSPVARDRFQQLVVQPFNSYRQSVNSL